jgi:hypothetical protein
MDSIWAHAKLPCREASIICSSTAVVDFACDTADTLCVVKVASFVAFGEVAGDGYMANINDARPSSVLASQAPVWLT